MRGVIARLDRAISILVASCSTDDPRGLLDSPLEAGNDRSEGVAAKTHSAASTISVAASPSGISPTLMSPI